MYILYKTCVTNKSKEATFIVKVKVSDLGVRDVCVGDWMRIWMEKVYLQYRYMYSMKSQNSAWIL